MPCIMRPKQQRLGLKVLLLSTCLVALGTSGCSDSASDDENLEATDNTNKADLGGDDAKEGNGQENYVDTDEGKGGNGGADVNSATGGEGGDPLADSGSGSSNLLGEAGPGNAPPANAAAPGNAPLNAPPANAATGATQMNATVASGPAAAMPPAAANPPPAAAAPSGPTSPVSGGRVRYVRDGGIQAVNAPNGSPVATLEQGEHPVTWEENGWLKITSGMYVPADGMSTTGVPRPQSGGGWAH